MSDWLNVPTPHGDVATLEYAIGDLRRTSAAVADQATAFATRAHQTHTGWDGATADVFEMRARAAGGAISAISIAHLRAAEQLEHYRNEFVEAREVSERARRDIQHAVDEYGHRARHAVDEAAHHLHQFIASNPIGKAVEGVTDFLGDALDGARNLVGHLQGWQAPHHAVILRTVTGPALPALDAGAILGHIRGAAEWGVSHLVDGARWIADHIGAAFSWAMRKLHEVEEWLAHAVAAALSLARHALEALWSFGKRIAKALWDLAVYLGKVIFEAVVKLVKAVVHLVIKVFDFLVALAEWLIFLPVILVEIQILKWKKVFDPEDPPRMANRGQASEDAARYYNRDDLARQRAIAFSELANDCYDPGHRGIPEEWILDRREGPDGFAAVVYRLPSGEIVVAFRGSQPGDAQDWHQDLLNAEGRRTSQGDQALEYAQEMVRLYGDEVVFTGHSLGGSLAAQASIATGHEAITFNAAGVGDGNYEAAMRAGGAGSSETQITNFRAPTDIVNMPQEATHTTPAAGRQVMVDSDAWAIDLIGQHGIDNMELEHGQFRAAVR